MLGPCRAGASQLAGEVLGFKCVITGHNVASKLYGFSLVTNLPWNRVGISVGYCCAVRMRMSSIAISGEGTRGPSLSTVLSRTTLKERK